MASQRLLRLLLLRLQNAAKLTALLRLPQLWIAWKAWSTEWCESWVACFGLPRGSNIVPVLVMTYFLLRDYKILPKKEQRIQQIQDSSDTASRLFRYHEQTVVECSAHDKFCTACSSLRLLALDARYIITYTYVYMYTYICIYAHI